MTERSAVAAHPLTRHVGAELSGIDLHRLDSAVIAALQDALLEHLVVFVPGQFLTPPELLAVARGFGEIFPNPMSPKTDGYPDVTELVTYDGGSPDIFHFDTSYVAVPPKLSMLTMVRCPPVGGDTIWASGYALLESFSPPMQEFLERLHVRYDPRGKGEMAQVAEHPLVSLHPDTGRAAFLLDAMWGRRIVELERAESDALLGFLRVHVTDPTFSCRYRWSEGTYALWDNRCTIHRVASDFIGERVIQRVTVAGEPLVPVR
jgi:taurine dioxygenase